MWPIVIGDASSNVTGWHGSWQELQVQFQQKEDEEEEGQEEGQEFQKLLACH